VKHDVPTYDVQGSPLKRVACPTMYTSTHGIRQTSYPLLHPTLSRMANKAPKAQSWTSQDILTCVLSNLRYSQEDALNGTPAICNIANFCLAYREVGELQIMPIEEYASPYRFVRKKGVSLNPDIQWSLTIRQLASVNKRFLCFASHIDHGWGVLNLYELQGLNKAYRVTTSFAWEANGLRKRDGLDKQMAR
jgi:hypothetical protein